MLKTKEQFFILLHKKLTNISLKISCYLKVGNKTVVKVLTFMKKIYKKKSTPDVFYINKHSDL